MFYSKVNDNHWDILVRNTHETRMITTYYPNCFAAVRVAGISANKRFLLTLRLPAFHFILPSPQHTHIYYAVYLNLTYIFCRLRKKFDHGHVELVDLSTRYCLGSEVQLSGEGQLSHMRVWS